MAPTPDIRPIKAELTWPLRHLVLRRGRPLSECEYQGDYDAETFHFGLYMDEELVGIASLYKDDHPKEAGKPACRIRGMAVHTDTDRSAHMSAILQACIDSAVANKAALVWCNVRLETTGHYEALGFVKEGGEFELPGLGPHRLMRKNLPEPTA